MPSRPPTFGKGARPAAKPTGFDNRLSRHARGYGTVHDHMRKLVLAEEPLCRYCPAERRMPSTIADHVVPKAEGGTDDRSNYAGCCRPCHAAKTAREASRARTRNVHRG